MRPREFDPSSYPPQSYLFLYRYTRQSLMLSFEQRFTALLYLHDFDKEVTFSWKGDGMSERKYFDLQIVKFTSLNSSAFNKMFIKSYTLPCTFLGQLTAFKKFKDFVGGNVCVIFTNTLCGWGCVGVGSRTILCLILIFMVGLSSFFYSV